MAEEEEEEIVTKKRRRDAGTKKKRRDAGPVVAADCISELPDCLLSVIIGYLPAKEAARTSLLSSRWRHLWSTSPLDLEDSSIWNANVFPRRRFGRAGPWSCDENWRVQTITNILASHRGCVHRFRVVHTRFRGRRSLVDGWVRILARKSVQEIVLHFPYSSPFKEREVPPSLLACESLTTLHLMNCQFPYTTRASLNLTNLRDLILNCVEVTEDALHSVLSCCTALQSLAVLYVGSLRRIHVRSRSLCTLRIGTSRDLQELFIEDAPNLERLLGNLLAHGGWLKVVSAPKLEILDYLTTQIDRLDLGNNAFKISLDRAEVSLSTPVHCLKTLAIEVNFHCCKQTKMLAGLLRCLPCLETLQLVCRFANSANHEVSDYWEPLDPIDCVDRQLKTVILEMYAGLVGELNFARFLVTKARVLKVMKFESRTSCSKRWVRKQEKILRLKGRASLDAQITFTKSNFRPHFSW